MRHSSLTCQETKSLTRNPISDDSAIKRGKPAQRSRRLEPDVFNPDGTLRGAGEERRLLDVAAPRLYNLIIRPLHHVQEMLGHASIEQTSTYLNVQRGGLRESMRKSDELPPRCNPVAISAEINRQIDENNDDVTATKPLIN
jgi:hypothetical protein